MTFDICHDCGNQSSYLLPAALTGVALVCWKGGLWMTRAPAGGWSPGARWGAAAMLWLVALAAARGAWVALG